MDRSDLLHTSTKYQGLQNGMIALFAAATVAESFPSATSTSKATVREKNSSTSRGLLHVKESKIKIKILACTRVCPVTYQGYADNSEKNISTTRRTVWTTRRKILRLGRLQNHRLHLRQLRLVMLGGSTSRTRTNCWQRLGARHLLALECGKSFSRPAILSTSATRWSQQRSGARQ
jgi:hypothetical protein